MGPLAAFVIAIHEDPSWATILTAFATAATAAIAAVAAAVALRGLKQSRNDANAARTQSESQALQTRAHRYLERYNEQHSVEARTRLHDFFMVKPEERADRLARWKAMFFGEKLDAVRGLNFWEELAGMYNRKLVDRDVIGDYFGSEALYIWGEISWFVEHQRATNSRRAMEQLEDMCEAIRKERAAADSEHPDDSPTGDPAQLADSAQPAGPANANGPTQPAATAHPPAN